MSQCRRCTESLTPDEIRRHGNCCYGCMQIIQAERDGHPIRESKTVKLWTLRTLDGLWVDPYGVTTIKFSEAVLSPDPEIFKKTPGFEESGLEIIEVEAVYTAMF